MKNDQFFMKLCDKKDDFPFLLREYSAQEEIFHLKCFLHMNLRSLEPRRQLIFSKKSSTYLKFLRSLEILKKLVLHQDLPQSSIVLKIFWVISRKIRYL